MWFLYGILNAGFLSARRLYDKKALTTGHVPPLTLSWSTRAIAAVIMLAGLIFIVKPGLNLPGSFYIAVALVTIGFYPLFSWLYYTALRDGKMSTTLPILGLIPVFSLIAAFFIRGEAPPLGGIIGVLCIAFSLYFMHFHTFNHPLQPFKEIVSEKPARKMMGVAIIATFGALIDKWGVDSGGPLLYATFNLMGAVLAVATIDAFIHHKQAIKPVFERWHIILTIGLIELGVFLFYNLAMAETPSIAYIVAMRDLSILITAAVGAYLFKEKVSGHTKISYLIAATGFILIAIN